ncbi:MAG: hypothetical protein FWG54_02040 [Bacteroidetes bacterium]|nr:hypothetical protein [Bacteroidota bacterium]
MKKLLLLSLCLWAGASVKAQTSEGYFNLTQLSFLMGEVNDNGPTSVRQNMIPSVVNINGYRANEYLSIGVGVGMVPLAYTIVPIFADFRITLFNDNLSPVIALKAGYSYAKSKKDIYNYYGADYIHRGGAMLNPEIGFKVMATKRADFILSIGYWYQHLKSETKSYVYYGGTRTINSDINRLSISLGFLFK